MGGAYPVTAESARSRQTGGSRTAGLLNEAVPATGANPYPPTSELPLVCVLGTAGEGGKGAEEEEGGGGRGGGALVQPQLCSPC